VNITDESMTTLEKMNKFTEENLNFEKQTKGFVENEQHWMIAKF
jgi:hypothetical protein